MAHCLTPLIAPLVGMLELYDQEALQARALARHARHARLPHTIRSVTLVPRQRRVAVAGSATCSRSPVAQVQAIAILGNLAAFPNYQMDIVHAGALRPLNELAFAESEALRASCKASLEAITRCLTPYSRRCFTPQATNVIRGQTRIRRKSLLSIPSSPQPEEYSQSPESP